MQFFRNVARRVAVGGLARRLARQYLSLRRRWPVASEREAAVHLFEQRFAEGASTPAEAARLAAVLAEGPVIETLEDACERIMAVELGIRELGEARRRALMELVREELRRQGCRPEPGDEGEGAGPPGTAARFAEQAEDRLRGEPGGDRL